MNGPVASPDYLSSDFSSSKHSEHPLSLYFQAQQVGFPPSLLHHYIEHHGCVTLLPSSAGALTTPLVQAETQSAQSQGGPILKLSV